ncbi:MAG: glutaconyl-CoA decarboxylase subunit alpha [Clostridiales Family XIII bacterium]|jgi:glutaconyl-CoA decarboxylase|nr:glutaconyl-CoA decarboxylase subunit alpha [Clostridiales Family XIII bacterium]
MAVKYGFPMHPYFEKMPDIGEPLKRVLGKNVEEIKAVEADIAEKVDVIKNKSVPKNRTPENMNPKGEWDVWQRIEYLVDPGTWCPLHTIYNWRHNEEGQSNVVDGLAKIRGKWAIVIAFNNRVIAGAWLAGQADNVLRVTNIAKRLHLPLVWILNCSGVKLNEQELIYPNRRGSGAPFFRHAELQKLGIPIIVGFYGTNPAGGGYHAISPSVLIAHKKANMSVGGAGIVSGMSPKGYIDDEVAAGLIKNTRALQATPPGRVEIHQGSTGFIRDVCETEEEVLDDIKRYMDTLPAYDPTFFRVAEPAEPKYPGEDLYSIIPFNQKRNYSMPDVLSRIFDNSEHLEFRPDYGPEMYCGLAKIDGFPAAFIANNSGLFTPPKYAEYPTVGGKLYREGLIKMNEFVTLTGRDRIPLIWIQDTTGIDVGDTAEKAEMLGLGMSLIYSIEQSDNAMMAVVLRKGAAAAHYVLGGPQANNNNCITLGTALTEIYVMHGETAAAAMFARRLVKDEDDGIALDGTIAKMNDVIQLYEKKSRPADCAIEGYVDEIVDLPRLRDYCKAFVGSFYQNPKSFCAIHQAITPRVSVG